MTAFSHSGDLGDLLAALPAIDALGGGNLVLYPSTQTGHRMRPDRAAFCIPFLEQQTYIHSCRWAPQPEGLNLDGWRRFYTNGFNLADMVCHWLSLPHRDRDHAWLTAEPSNIAPRVIMARTGRYAGWFPWKRAVEQYGKDAAFIGSEFEHKRFCEEFGQVRYITIDDMADAASLIAGSQLVLCNQTMVFWLAEGLKRVVYLEAGSPKNCHFDRWGHASIESVRDELPSFDELQELNAENDRRVKKMLRKPEPIKLAQ